MIEYSLGCLERMEKELSYRNIFDIFLSHGERTALEYKLRGEIKKISFGELELPVKHIADNLIKKLDGTKEGFVALKLDNCPEWPCIFWGIMMAGFKPFLIDYRHAQQITQFFIRQAGAVAIISAEQEDTGCGTVSIQADELIKCDREEIYVLAKTQKPEGNYKDRISAYSWADEIALCTSGTTSTAKVYTYNGEAMGHQILGAKQIIEENERFLSDRPVKNLAFLPFHHIFGFLASYLWYSFFGGTLVFPAGKAPSQLLTTCREHGVTHILAVPLLINNIVAGINRKLAKESKFKQTAFKCMCSISLWAQKINPEKGIDLAKKMFKKSVLDSLVGTSLELIISGGGHVLPETLRIINAIGYYTVCGFGMTEVGVSSVDIDSRIERRLSGCVGLPLNCVEYKIVSDNPEKPNVGELKMRGSSLHTGMMVNGEQIPPQLDDEGWFSTGDIGRLENGALYIEGRLKEIIINESGENVYPDEIEDYFTGLEGINQFSIVGIAKEKGGKYEDITLVLESSNELADIEYISKLTDAINERNSNLPVFKKINSALITNDPLPLSNGIKVKRAEIKKQIESGSGRFKKIR